MTTIFKAEQLGHLDEVPSLRIVIDETIPTQTSLEAARRLFAEQGRELATMLRRSLPGGTLDALLAELFAQKASLFRVTHDDPRDGQRAALVGFVDEFESGSVRHLSDLNTTYEAACAALGREPKEIS